MAQTLPFALQVRMSGAQRSLLERLAHEHDLTLSGAVRHLLDAEIQRDADELARDELGRLEDGTVVPLREAVRHWDDDA